MTGMILWPRAAAGGAGLLVVEEKPEKDHLPPGVAVVQVADTLKALGRLAAWHRQRFSIPVIGVTGSNGKTTTKEMLAALLPRRFRVVKNLLNYNNEIGLPLTLLTVREGIRKLSSWRWGCAGKGRLPTWPGSPAQRWVSSPMWATATWSSLGSREAIARAKGELIAALPRDGLAVLNGDDPRVRPMDRLFPGSSLFYGLEGDGLDLRGNARPVAGGQEVAVTGKWGDFTFFLPLPGRHNVANALAATTAALALAFLSRRSPQA